MIVSIHKNVKRAHKPRTRKAALKRAQRAAELHDTIRNPMKTAAWREYREAHVSQVEM